MSLLAPALPRRDELPGQWVDVIDLAAAPRRPVDETEALEGRCRGALLADWSENFANQWGADAPQKIRQGLGDLGSALPDAPGAVAWYPVGLQLRVTELLLDEVVDGDAQGLRDALMALVDGHRAARFLARRLGLKRLISQVSGLFGQCYDRGRTEVRVTPGHGVITMAGADLVTHPTWQLLQLVGYEVLAELSGHPDAVVSGRIGAGRLFEVHVRW
ncbi:MAG: hypothetical protein ACPGU1_03210 [Myxococcota bacterium]